MTVGELILQARYGDPSFTDRRHTSHVLRARVADYQKHLARRVGELAPEELALPYDIDMPLPDHEAGHLLVEVQESIEIRLRYLRVLNEGEWVNDQDEKGPIEVIPNEMRFANSRVPPIIILNGRVYPRGSARDWEDLAAVRLRLFYIPLPADEIGDDEEPLFHDLAVGTYDAFLAFVMASRSKPAELARPLQDFRLDLQEAEMAFLSAITARHVMSERVRQVW